MPDSTISPVDNPVVTYHYEDADYPTFLTGITNALNERFAIWDYDADGRVTLSKHAGDADETAIAFNTDGTKTVTFPLGEQRKYTFATIKGAPKVVREDRLAVGSIPAAYQLYAYDTNGFLSSFTDWRGNVTKHTFNTRGLETSRSTAGGKGGQCWRGF